MWLQWCINICEGNYNNSSTVANAATIAADLETISAPVTEWISKINNTQEDNVKDLDII